MLLFLIAHELLLLISPISLWCWFYNVFIWTFTNLHTFLNICKPTIQPQITQVQPGCELCRVWIPRLDDDPTNLRKQGSGVLPEEVQELLQHNEWFPLGPILGCTLTNHKSCHYLSFDHDITYHKCMLKNFLLNLIEPNILVNHIHPKDIDQKCTFFFLAKETKSFCQVLTWLDMRVNKMSK